MMKNRAMTLGSYPGYSFAAHSHQLRRVIRMEDIDGDRVSTFLNELTMSSLEATAIDQIEENLKLRSTLVH